MINEAYCSFEVSKLLKEKGFPQQEYINTFPYYTQNGNLYFGDINTVRQRYCAEAIGITQSLALKWLREVYNIHIEIRYVPDKFTDEPCYKAMIWDMNTEIGTPLSPDVSYTYFETCVEAALKYTLENLI